MKFESITTLSARILEMGILPVVIDYSGISRFSSQSFVTSPIRNLRVKICYDFPTIE